MSKQQKFIRKVVSFLVEDTESKLIDRVIYDLSVGNRFINYSFGFPWRKRSCDTYWGEGHFKVDSVLKWDMWEDYNTDTENFSDKYGNFIDYVNEVYCVKPDESFEVWDLYRKNMLCLYNLTE
tara:strand:+ start:33 stop:401 length:369 start_codon:yes stop_codon:yes gene_type:complete